MFPEVTAAVFAESACPDVCDSSVSLFNVLLKLLKKVKGLLLFDPNHEMIHENGATKCRGGQLYSVMLDC